jgi:hypothetical protein
MSRTEPWDAVEAHFARLASFPGPDSAPMRRLVAMLARSPCAAALFPCTSMFDLRIGRVADFADGDGELRVRFDPLRQRFHFEYFPSPRSKPWTARCEATRIDDYVPWLLQRRLRWFSGWAPPA